MSLYKPSELQKFLDEIGATPNKKLSQNFLIDGNIIRKILLVSNVTPNETVLEIGPGPGALTEALLKAGASVIAVEKDSLFAQSLERFKTSPSDLEVHCSDILTFPLEPAILPRLSPDSKAKVIANLPYHLTSPILGKLVPLHYLFESITVMVQQEVAMRMTATSGSSDYSSFSIFIRAYSTPSYAFTVSRNCFYPVPNVDSAIVTLTLRKPPLASHEVDTFFKIVRSGFQQRRKMLRSSLKNMFPPNLIEEALTAIGESPLARPEELSLEKFLELHKILSPKLPNQE